MNKQGLDPLSVAVLFFTWLLGAQAGAVVGTYSIIFVCALTGAGYALSRREPSTWWAALGFIALVVVATMLTTVPVTVLLLERVPKLAFDIVLPLVALVISGIGHDWGRIFRWGFREALAKYRSWRGLPPADPQQP
jgi:uncharacterized membrane protein